ncbi:MAG: hypothetical protein EOM76_01070 [Sphingobacteriia bacterium]|jgi:hypothetical protein|nr:hypothetical protein [Paludibacteraceae bacterium]NCA78775.1 hypothetical protein [Sphingobacteriia bacterium]
MWRKKIVLTCVFGLLITIGGYVMAQLPNRVPAVSGLLEIEQPDGYKLRIYLCGDEHNSWRMTADGYLILADERGFYCYAHENCSGEILPSKHKAKNEEDRTKREERFLERQNNNAKLKFTIRNDYEK